jgi:hypothetical protein
MNLADRIARLEERYRPARPASPLTDYALERMTMTELGELKALLLDAGDVEVDELPDEPKARAMALIDAASRRPDPAPLASMEPGYDVMAETRRAYNASKARGY